MTSKADRDRLFAAARAYAEWCDAGPHPLPDDEDYEHPIFDEFMLALIHVTGGQGWDGAGGLARLIVALGTTDE